MTAYNRVNQVYSAEHPELVRDILKGSWGFQGFVESDWVLGTRSTVPSALAGLDIEMPAGIYYGAPLVKAVQSGELDASVIDEAVRRILRQKLCFALDAPKAVAPSVVESAEHVALAREVAEKALVLLKNRAGVLPLDQNVRTLALVGSLSDVANLGDRGSSSVTPSATVSPAAGLRARMGEERLLLVPTDSPSEDELSRIASADAAIVVAGLTYREEGEFIPIEQEIDGLARGGDRLTLNLPPAQEALIQRVAARAKKTIVVLEGGSAIVVEPWIDSVDALLMAWYPGMEGGAAIAGALFGDTNPSGKLPVSFPRSMAQLPPWDVQTDQVEYGYLHGYRLLDANREEPRFPFGFGLSYTSFALGRLRLERRAVARQESVRISVDVYNQSRRAGAEVLQLYVSFPGSSVQRAPKELRGFRRISLEAGEVRTVQFELPVRELGHYDPQIEDFVVEPVEYVVQIGTSSRHLPLRAHFRVE
jgi:beta-glucosidase